MQGLLCLLDGMALGHVVQSYVREATITFTADRNVMPDPEFYSQCLRESFEEMADAAGLDLSPPKPAPTPKKTVSSRKSTATTKRKSTSTTTKRATTRKSKAKAG
jgi:hypothetical protein